MVLFGFHLVAQVEDTSVSIVEAPDSTITLSDPEVMAVYLGNESDLFAKLNNTLKWPMNSNCMYSKVVFRLLIKADSTTQLDSVFINGSLCNDHETLSAYKLQLIQEFNAIIDDIGKWAPAQILGENKDSFVFIPVHIHLE